MSFDVNTNCIAKLCRQIKRVHLPMLLSFLNVYSTNDILFSYGTGLH